VAQDEIIGILRLALTRVLARAALRMTGVKYYGSAKLIEAPNRLG
jgi:hypothetical protein